jgi:hypothetical protein
MVGTEYFKTRKDGVKLYRTIDAVVDVNGKFILDENKNLIPTGFMVKQVQTGYFYSEAIDVEGAPYTYEETDKLIEFEEEDNGKEVYA